MDCICLKRKHRKRPDQNKFRPITPQTSPTHSQPSTLGPDPRLPKVNSTGLWVGAPSMYSGMAPSPAYYYGPSKMPPSVAQPHPRLISRASSETRIPNNGYPYASSPPSMYGSHGDLLIMPVVSGMQPRIFHSSQPLTPLFEIPNPSRASNGMEIYDVYQFGGGNSRSKLVEEKHSKHYYAEAAKSNSKLARSQSDIQQKPKRPVSRHSKTRDSSSNQAAPKVNRTSSSNSKDMTPREQLQRKQRQAPAPPRPSSSVILTQQHSRTNSREMRLSASAPGNRIGMKSKSLDSLDGVGGGGYYNKAFDAGFVDGRLASLSGDIILKPAAPNPPKVAVVAAAPYLSSSSTPRSDILPNGVLAGNVSTSNKDKDKNSNDIIIGENEIQVDTSATDSMKLLAKNKTDDQKTVVAVGKPSSPSDIISKLSSSTPSVKDIDVVIEDVLNTVEDKDLSKGHVHYIYQGDIYAVPDKGTSLRDESENPIISRMKEMVVEKTRINSTKSVLSSRDHLNESLPPSANNTPRSFISTSSADIIIENEYQEIGDIVKSMENTNKDDDDEKNGVLISNDTTENEVIESSHLQTAHKDIESDNSNLVNGEIEFSKPGNGDSAAVNDHKKIGWGDAGQYDAVDGREISVPASPVDVKPADTTFDEINNAGKQITDSAFEFLNTYLSDDEGGDGHISP